MKTISRVMIVGGGTAGWLTAAFLAKSLGSTAPGAVAVTVVESPEIATIGVGEGSFPSMRGTLAAIGIDEARFIRECHATFKQGIKFVDWVRPPGTPGVDHYFHPFSLPSQRAGGPELLPYWLQGVAPTGVAFADAVTMQKRIADQCHAPKREIDKDFLGPMKYAYHFDAGLFAGLLERHAKTLGVEHQQATIADVVLTEDGAIAELQTSEGERLSADLYIDCTGFRAALIGKALGSPFQSVDDTLFVDRAVAMQVPYSTPESSIPSYTVSTAQTAGWIWDIGLQQRRGIGYVYASRYQDDASAEKTLRDYIGPAADAHTARVISLKLGYRPQQWVKNCVAVGLSGGFLEPLEASGIGLVETAAYYISYLFPMDGNQGPVAALFNDLMRQRYERIVDFIKMHYCLTQRRDSAFWRDNVDPVSDKLKQQLAMWRSRPPHRLDFVSDVEMYPCSSWQYVLYGMEFQTTLPPNPHVWHRAADAAKEFEMIAMLSQRALKDLPTHRALIHHLCQRR